MEIKRDITTETLEDGATVDLSGCTEIIIQGTATASANKTSGILFYINGAVTSAIVAAFDQTTYGKAIYYYGIHNGHTLVPVFCGRGPMVQAAIDPVRTIPIQIPSLSSVTKIIVQSQSLSECNIEIYAK